MVASMKSTDETENFYRHYVKKWAAEWKILLKFMKMSSLMKSEKGAELIFFAALRREDGSQIKLF